MLFDDGSEIRDKHFRARLQLASLLIRQEAAGRICGTCRHYRGSWCAEQKNIEGQPLAILYPDAPACKEHENP